MTINFSQDNYWINVEKPVGYSSAKVVAIVKRITAAKKVGHGGTLDPFAEGVLPVAINKATKTCQHIMDAKKRYFFRITWGEFRDTDDIEGKVEETSNLRPTNDQIIAILPFFIGKIKQTPSRFSALKIDGKRAYELARKEIDFEIKQREVEISFIKMLANNSQYGDFEVECSKGTYVRSIVRDLCKKMAICGYVSQLKRLEVGKFNYKKIISLAKLKRLVNYGGSFFDGSLLSLHDVLDFMVEIKLDDLDASRFRNGQIVTINNVSDCSSSNLNHNSDDFVSKARVVNNGILVGLGEFGKNLLKPINVF